MNNITGKLMKDEEYVPFAVELQVSDFEKSFAFYRDVLGFKVNRINQRDRFASLSFNGSLLMIKEISNLSPQCSSCIVVRFIVNDDLRKYFDLFISRGAKVLKPIEEMSYGLKRFYIGDPDGYHLKFAAR